MPESDRGTSIDRSGRSVTGESVEGDSLDPSDSSAIQGSLAARVIRHLTFISAEDDEELAAEEVANARRKAYSAGNAILFRSLCRHLEIEVELTAKKKALYDALKSSVS